jgi:hypothetical protein
MTTSPRPRTSSPLVPKQDGVADFVKTLYQRIKVKAQVDVCDTYPTKAVNASGNQNSKEFGAAVICLPKPGLTSGVAAPTSFSGICLTAVDEVGTMEQLLTLSSPSSPGIDYHDSQFNFNEVIFPAGSHHTLAASRPAKRKYTTKLGRDGGGLPQGTEHLSYYQRTKLLHAKKNQESGGIVDATEAISSSSISSTSFVPASSETMRKKEQPGNKYQEYDVSSASEKAKTIARIRYAFFLGFFSLRCLFCTSNNLPFALTFL